MRSLTKAGDSLAGKSDESANYTKNRMIEEQKNVEAKGGSDNMAILMLLLGMVSAIVIVVFALQNGRVVTVSFFDWSVEASLVLVIMITALMGFLTALFFELFVQIKLRFRLYKMGRQVKALEAEVAKLQSVQNAGKTVSAYAKEPSVTEENPIEKTGLGA